MKLSERKGKILAEVVDAYVTTGEPVGSKGIAAKLGVSSATVRNEMADLSEIGLIEQPHTSAGRVPSELGYRLYIDQLMQKPKLSLQEKRYLDSILLASAYDPEKLLESVSQVLAGMTRFAAVSTTPCGSCASIRAIQFVQTSRRTAMVIMMSSAGTMKNCVFHCDFDVTPDILHVFFRIFNERLVGKPVSSVTPAFIQSMAASLGDMAALMSSALMAVLQVADDTMQTDVCLNGQMNLLFYPEFENGQARRVMDFLDRPQDLARLLLQQPSVVKILVGSETNRPELADSSVVIARYDIAGQCAGALGVIGPTRMNYGRTVASLEYLSDRVSQMLTVLMKEE